MKILDSKNSYGGILYFDDVINASFTGSLTSTNPVSVDSKFSITLSSTASASSYDVQVNNSNPFLVQSATSFVVNPDFNNNWVNLGSVNNSGYFWTDGVYRFARLTRPASLSGNNVNAYFYMEKLSPVIR